MEWPIKQWDRLVLELQAFTVENQSISSKIQSLLIKFTMRLTVSFCLQAHTSMKVGGDSEAVRIVFERQ